MMTILISIIVGLFSGFSGVILTIFSQKNIANRKLKDSLDSKSEWRKKLYDSASKAEIDLGDIYRLRASLRFKAKENTIDIKIDSCEEYFNFDNMTYKMINHCDKMIDQYSIGTNSKKIDRKNAEITRIYLRYLLKYQWEVLSRDEKKMKEYKKNEEKILIKETLKILDTLH